MQIKDAPFEIIYKDEVATITADKIVIKMRIRKSMLTKMYNWGKGGKVGSGTLSVKTEEPPPKAAQPVSKVTPQHNEEGQGSSSRPGQSPPGTTGLSGSGVG